MPDLLVRLVAHELLIEVLAIDGTPLSSSPCGEVNTVGHIAHVVLFRIVAVPDRSEHLLRNPSVKLRHTVYLLTGVAGEGRHTELLSVVVGVRTAHADELIPSDTQLSGIATHILTEQTLVEVVVTGRYGCVNGIE